MSPETEQPPSVARQAVAEIPDSKQRNQIQNSAVGYTANSRDQEIIEAERAIDLAAALTVELAALRPGPEHDFGRADLWKAARKMAKAKVSMQDAVQALNCAMRNWGESARSSVTISELAEIVNKAMADPIEPDDQGEDSPPREVKLAMRWFKDTPEEVPDWLWTGYLLRRATSVLGGRQGIGKGLVITDIVARLTSGRAMPDGTGNGEVIKVLIVTREDDPAMAMAPRLRVAGADMANVAWTHGDYGIGDDDAAKAAESMAAAAPIFESAVKENGIGLLIVDPLGAWIEDDGNSASQIRAVIDPMNRLARRTGCAVLFVAHLRKAAAEEPMDAFAGSYAITAAVRTAIMVDRISETEFSLMVVKSNFRRPETAMVWTMVGGSDRDPPTVAWRPGTAEDAVKAIERVQRKAPSVNPADVRPHLVASHRRLKDEARRVHRLLLPTIPRITVAGVTDAMVELIAQRGAYEGIASHGARTIGLEAMPVIESATDRARAAWRANPQATVREIADIAGCSRSQADRAKPSDLSHGAVP